MKHDRDSTSTFVALRNRLYRKLWFAVLLSGTCVSAHDTAATWTMNSLGSSTFLLSLMSTVAALPIFLFTPPAGILADTINRRKLLCFVNVWLAAAAGLLALLGLFHLVNPPSPMNRRRPLSAATTLFRRNKVFKWRKAESIPMSRSRSHLNAVLLERAE